MNSVLRSPFQLLKDSWAVFIKNIVFFVCFGVFMHAGQTLLLYSMPIEYGNMASVGEVIELFQQLIPLWGVTFLFYLVVQTFAALYVFSFAEGKTIEWGKLWIHAIKIIPAVLFVFIAQILIVGGGFLFFFIPGVILLFWMMFVSLMIIRNGGRLVDSFMDSKKMVRGRFFLLTWRYGLWLLVSILFGIVSGLLVLLPSGEIWGGLFDNIVLFPLTLIYFVLLFLDFEKTAEPLPPQNENWTKIVYGFMGIFGLVFFSLLVVFGLSALKKGMETDEAREMQSASVIESLRLYYAGNKKYPDTLQILVPEFLPELPRDPRSNILYDYILKTDGQDYKFCVDYDLRGRKCQDSKGEPYFEVPSSNDEI